MPANLKTRRIRVGIDLHNLSTRPDCSVRTGIQQVVFNFLRAQYALRAVNNETGLEVVPLPLLPTGTEGSKFTDLKPTQVNNAWCVLVDTAKELQIELSDLWTSEFTHNENWSETYFYEIAAELDWIFITGLCEFRNVIENIKKTNPEIRVGVFVHDIIPSMAPQLTARGMPDWFENCYLSSIQYYADLLITNSRHTALDCSQFLSPLVGPNVPIVALPLPAEVPEFSAEPKLDVSWLGERGLTPQCYFVCLGTIEPRKNLALAIHGFVRFLKLYPQFKHFKLCMVGKSGWNNEEESIRTLTKDYADSIIFTGYLDRASVERTIAYAAALAMPSRYEGFGMPLSIAAQYDVPTVSSIHSSLPEAASSKTIFVRTDSVDEMALAFFQIASAKESARSPMTRQDALAAWNTYTSQILYEMRHFKELTPPQLHVSKGRRKIVFDVHNLSISMERMQKTGIQEVSHAILHAVSRVRKEYEAHAEVLCIPTLPCTGYVTHYATTFTCPPRMIRDLEEHIGLSSRELWGFDLKKYGYSFKAEDFKEVLQGCDDYVVICQYDVRRIYAALKEAAPHVSISYLVHDIIPTLYPNAVAGGLAQWFTYQLLRTVRSHASKVFGVSRSAAIDFLNFTEDEKFDGDVFSLRLPINQSSQLPSDAQALRLHKLEVQKYFVIVGSTDPRKNVANSIRGFIKFCDIFPELANEYSLVIVGPRVWRTQDIQDAQRAARGVCRVIDAGYVSDAALHTLVSQSCGLLMASRYEGFGIPLALARSYGVPVLTCANSSLPEVCELEATFVDPNNIFEFALGYKNMITKRERHPVINDTWDHYVRELIEQHL